MMVPILTYHSLDQSGSVISMAPAAFREQMRLLAARGFVGIGLGQLLDAWGGRATLPARPVVLTFDDGYSSFIEHAAPTLTALGFSVYDNRWELAAYELGSNLRLGVRFPIRYREGQDFNLSLDDVQFEVPDVDPAAMVRDLGSRIF